MTRKVAEARPQTPTTMDGDMPAIRLPTQTYRQRQVDELYDLYDLVMIERLLKGHPSLEELIGS
ncbi:MAG: hypothetical protein JSW48_15185 [Betaproteobacteria bacterium]|jgi:hypothetical protein|nr:MAG: hypothetical protein JSW48_15185 [Betaproteobacteria bacterium]